MDAYTTGNAKFVDEDYAAAIEVGGVLKATMPLWMQPFHRQVNDVIVTIRNAIFLKNKKRENQSRTPGEKHTPTSSCVYRFLGLIGLDRKGLLAKSNCTYRLSFRKTARRYI